MLRMYNQYSRTGEEGHLKRAQNQMNKFIKVLTNNTELKKVIVHEFIHSTEKEYKSVLTSDQLNRLNDVFEKGKEKIQQDGVKLVDELSNEDIMVRAKKELNDLRNKLYFNSEAEINAWFLERMNHILQNVDIGNSIFSWDEVKGLFDEEAAQLLKFLTPKNKKRVYKRLYDFFVKAQEEN